MVQKMWYFWSPAAFDKAGYLTLEKAEEKQKKVE